ncbi:MAG TPA: DUF1835 domain-containing protein [Sediminibacterium sp.]|nr:DUF1835 domain-containing protein [Sediminibacterium sp.]
MTHIVFEEPAQELLEKTLELDPSLQGPVVQVKDDYAVGPLGEIFATEGYQTRKSWWEELLRFSPYTESLELVNDKLMVHQLCRQLDENPDETVWIWMGQNAHDVCGYYWLMSQLKAYQGRIQVLFLNNLPFLNEKGQLYYPVYLSEILPKELLKARRLSRPITLSEFELDPDEWKKICEENAMVRYLEGGKKISGKPVDFYDKDILQQLGKESVKLPRLLMQLFTKMKLKTGDVFLVWRIREMAAAGKLQVSGDWEKGWKDLVISPVDALEKDNTAQTAADA